MKRASLLLLLLITLPAFAQHPNVPRSLRALPPIDAAVAPDFAAALTLVDQTLRMRAPQVMARTPQQDLSRKLQQALAPWLHRRIASTQAAEAALQALAARSPMHAVVAAALVGMLWNDFATQLSSLAPPAQIRSDPTLLATYQRLLDEQTEPFRERARAAYGTCAHSPVGGAWAAYCTAQLPPTP